MSPVIPKYETSRLQFSKINWVPSGISWLLRHDAFLSAILLKQWNSSSFIWILKCVARISWSSKSQYFTLLIVELNFLSNLGSCVESYLSQMVIKIFCPVKQSPNWLFLIYFSKVDHRSNYTGKNERKFCLLHFCPPYHLSQPQLIYIMH